MINIHCIRSIKFIFNIRESNFTLYKQRRKVRLEKFIITGKQLQCNLYTLIGKIMGLIFIEAKFKRIIFYFTHKIFKNLK